MRALFHIAFFCFILCAIPFSARAGSEPETQDTAPTVKNARRFDKESLLKVSEADQRKFYGHPSDENRRPQKSVWKGMALSLILPGTGEWYAQYGKESLIKGIGFFAAEITGVLVYLHYKNKGKRFENKYEKFADRNWDVDKYLAFLETSLVSDPDFEIASGDLGRKSTGINYTLLVQAENEWAENSGVSVHHLFENTRQQYYEMIYKYPEQFALGWADIPSDHTVPYPNTGYTRSNLTSMMADYRNLRFKSNDYLSTARGMTGVIMINHLLSMADAAWTVKKWNSADDIKKVTLSLRIEQRFHYNTLMTMPTLRFTY